MSARTLHGSIFKIFQYTSKVLSTNENFTQEDIDWVTDTVKNMYEKMTENIYFFYMFLTLINQRCFCGYFARIYNNSILKCVKERNHISLINLMIRPVLDEFENNPSLTEEEIQELKDMLSLEVFTTNLTIKRFTLLDNSIDDIEKVYIESYKDIYTKLFSEKIKTNRAEFQNYIIITEEKNGIDYVNAFYLHDVLSQVLTDKDMNNTEVIKEKYNLELKLVYHTLKYYSK